MGCCSSTQIDENSPEAIAKSIWGTIKGLGTNDTKLISLVTAKRSNEAMKAIVKAYSKMGEGRDIIKDIKGDTSFNYKTALVSMCTDIHTLQAEMVHKAIKGLGTDERLLNEIICSRTKKDLDQIGQRYQDLYEKSMVDEIKADLTGLFESSDYRALIMQCLGHDKSDPADEKKGMEDDIKVLYKAGEARWGTDEKAFIKILAGRSRKYLAKLNVAYGKVHEKTLVEAIKSETSGDFCDAMCFLCQPVDEFVADKLYKAMKGLGTDDTTLIFTIVVFRHDVLVPAAKLFKQKYEKSLEEWVSDETSGDYKKTMLSILKNYLGTEYLNIDSSEVKVQEK